MKKIAVVMVAMVVVFSISGLVFETNELKYTETTEVSIQQGDTLWNIASDVNSDRYNNHKIVLEIKELNKLKSSHIIPGQKIKVPVLDKDSP